MSSCHKRPSDTLLCGKATFYFGVCSFQYIYIPEIKTDVLSHASKALSSQNYLKSPKDKKMEKK